MSSQIYNSTMYIVYTIIYYYTLNIKLDYVIVYRVIILINISLNYFIFI